MIRYGTGGWVRRKRLQDVGPSLACNSKSSWKFTRFSVSMSPGSRCRPEASERNELLLGSRYRTTYAVSLAPRVRRMTSPERAMVPCRATLAALSSTCSNLLGSSAREENSRERPEEPGRRLDGLIGKYLSLYTRWASALGRRRIRLDSTKLRSLCSTSPVRSRG